MGACFCAVDEGFRRTFVMTNTTRSALFVVHYGQTSFHRDGPLIGTDLYAHRASNTANLADILDRLAFIQRLAGKIDQLRTGDEFQYLPGTFLNTYATCCAFLRIDHG